MLLYTFLNWSKEKEILYSWLGYRKERHSLKLRSSFQWEAVTHKKLSSQTSWKLRKTVPKAANWGTPQYLLHGFLPHTHKSASCLQPSHLPDFWNLGLPASPSIPQGEKNKSSFCVSSHPFSPCRSSWEWLLWRW